MMNNINTPRVLCVDDEPRVVEGLKLHLYRSFQVYTANSGQEALETLRQLGSSVAVIVSDMRMPGMDGATLLKQVRELYPETTRILLTGEPGRDAAIQAINEAQVFRFLTKPSTPEQVLSAVSAGAAQHQLLSTEKVLLQETLVGCIKAMIDVLAIANPTAFGRSTRVTRHTIQFADSLGKRGFWQLEAAAMLSQLGYISLPTELIDKLCYGAILSPEEQKQVNGAPQVVQKLLGHIPRMDSVLHILNEVNAAPAAAKDPSHAPSDADILRLTLDYDSLIAKCPDVSVALQAMRAHAHNYHPQLIEPFAKLVGAGKSTQEIREIPLGGIQSGMIFLDDLRMPNGLLLVPKGFEVTDTFLERMRNFRSSMLAEKRKMLVTT